MEAEKAPTPLRTPEEIALMDDRFKKSLGPGKDPLKPLDGFGFGDWRDRPPVRTINDFPMFNGIPFENKLVTPVQNKESGRGIILHSVGFAGNANQKMGRMLIYLQSLISCEAIQRTAAAYVEDSPLPYTYPLHNVKNFKYYSVTNSALKYKICEKYGLPFRDQKTVDSLFVDIVMSGKLSLVVVWIKKHPILKDCMLTTSSGRRPYNPDRFAVPRECVSPRYLLFENSMGLHPCGFLNGNNICWFINLLPFYMFLMNLDEEPGIVWGNIHDTGGIIDMTDQQIWQMYLRTLDSQTVFSAEKLSRFKRRFCAIYKLNVLCRSLNDITEFKYLSIGHILNDIFATLRDVHDTEEGGTQHDGAEIIQKIANVMLETRDEVKTLFTHLYGTWNPNVSELFYRILFVCDHCHLSRVSNTIRTATLQVTITPEDFQDDPHKEINIGERLSSLRCDEGAQIRCPICDRFGPKNDLYDFSSISNKFVVKMDRLASVFPSGQPTLSKNPVSLKSIRLTIRNFSGEQLYVHYKPVLAALGFNNLYSGGAIGPNNFESCGHWRCALVRDRVVYINEDSLPFLPLCSIEDAAGLIGSYITAIHYVKMTDEEVRNSGFDPEERPPHSEPPVEEFDN